MMYVAPIPFPPVDAPAAGALKIDDEVVQTATAFRSWTWPSPLTEPEPIPGLRQLLGSIGLSSYAAAVEEWCTDMGAAFLLELAEETVLQAISEEIGRRLGRGNGGLEPAEQLRLRRAVLQAVSNTGTSRAVPFLNCRTTAKECRQAPLRSKSEVHTDWTWLNRLPNGHLEYSVHELKVSEKQSTVPPVQALQEGNAIFEPCIKIQRW